MWSFDRGNSRILSILCGVFSVYTVFFIIKVGYVYRFLQDYSYYPLLSKRILIILYRLHIYLFLMCFYSAKRAQNFRIFYENTIEKHTKTPVENTKKTRCFVKNTTEFSKNRPKITREAQYLSFFGKYNVFTGNFKYSSQKTRSNTEGGK